MSEGSEGQVGLPLFVYFFTKGLWSETLGEVGL